MYYKLVNQKDLNDFKDRVRRKELPEVNDWNEEDINAILVTLDDLSELLGILDSEYGESRHPEFDLGGFSYVFITIQDYERYQKEIFAKHHMENLESEYEDTLGQGTNIEFVREVFLLSSDYSMILVYPRKRG